MSKIYRRHRERLRREFGYRCGFCGISEVAVAAVGVENAGMFWVEHFTPAAERPEAEISAGVYSCRRCLISIGTRPRHSTSGDLVHRRMVGYENHLGFREDGRAIPLSPSGDRTIKVANINDPIKIAARRRETEIRQLRSRMLSEVPRLIRKLEELATEDSLSLSIELRRISRDVEETYRQFPEPLDIIVDRSLDDTGEEPEAPMGPQWVALGVMDGSLRLMELSPDGTYRLLDETQSLSNILHAFSTETLCIKRAVDELESLVNDSKTKEADLQSFFERNPDFIINDDYKTAHPHLKLESKSGELLIPDFVLEPVGESLLCDLLELKLPTVQIFVLKKGRIRYSAAVLEACAQLRIYSQFFDEEKNRIAMHDKYGVSAYKPRMFVIIGRRSTLDPVKVRSIQSDTPALLLKTYDDILERMKNKVELMKHERRYR